MPRTPAPREGRALRRGFGSWGILQVSLGSVIGSGWLFGALFASQVAGTSAIVSWVVGGVAMAVIGLIYAELSSMYSVSGGGARYTHYAFGTVAGFGIGWFAWLSGGATAAIEVEASLQYSTNYLHWLSHSVNGVVVLRPVGYAIAIALLALFTLINIYAMRLIARINSIAATWKVVTLFLVIVVIAVTRFHPGNFGAGGGFAPFGLHGTIAALSVGGVIFAFTGFEQAVQLGGETANPGRNIPLALIGSLGIVTLLYVGLQVVFIGALSGPELAHGWDNVTFNGIFGPFAGLCTTLGIGWLAYVLYADAIISPGSNGLIYVTTTSRLSYAMSRNGYVPEVLERTRHGVPVYSVIVTFLVGVLCLVPFPGWQQLVGFITSGVALMYAGAPLALGALRRQKPGAHRPFRLGGAAVLSPLGFIIANLIVYWGGWAADWKLFLSIAIGFLVLAVSYSRDRRAGKPRLEWRSAVWMAPWLIGLAIVSYVGQYSAPGHPILGLGHIPFGWDIAVVSALSLGVYYLAMAVRLPAAQVQHYEQSIELVEELPTEPAAAAVAA